MESIPVQPYFSASLATSQETQHSNSFCCVLTRTPRQESVSCGASRNGKFGCTVVFWARLFAVSGHSEGKKLSVETNRASLRHQSEQIQN